MKLLVVRVVVSGWSFSCALVEELDGSLHTEIVSRHFTGAVMIAAFLARCEILPAGSVTRALAALDDFTYSITRLEISAPAT